MVTQAFKTTYTLDLESLERIDFLSAHWRTSKAEVVRRCVKNEVDRLVHRKNPLQVLEALEKNPEILLDTATIQNWNQELQETRKDWER